MALQSRAVNLDQTLDPIPPTIVIDRHLDTIQEGFRKRHALSQSADKTFPHRRNPDGTFDSICTQCFVTVATEGTEAELQSAERSHACQGLDLGRMMHGTDQRRQPGRGRTPARSEPQAG